MAFLKPQSPLSQGDNYFYPLTTSDQVIMDGGYRLNDIVNKVKKSTIMLYANRWSDTKPSIYSVEIKGLSDNVNMKILPHFPEDFEGKQAMKDETAKISFASRNDNVITFECWDETPTIDIPIDIEIDIVYPIKGASIEMNYSVVGSLNEPSDPTENMMWVNTDQRITDWKFNKYEPKNPKEGMIWFITSNKSNVSFFTLAMDGKEFDEVYPLSAKQYVSGAWADVEAKSYQNGEWVYWFPPNVLYRDGTINKDLGGGLEVYRTVGNSSVTFGDSTFSVHVAETTHSAIVGTKEKVDLSKYTKLIIVVDSAETDSTMFMSVRNDRHNTAWSDIFNGSLAVTSFKTAGTYELNVANCGTAYVCFGGVETYPQTMVVSEWYFE